MSFLGIEFNDASITGVSGGQIVFAEPGCALTDSSAGRPQFGAGALAGAWVNPRDFHDRYWRDLSEQPVATGIEELASYADLAYAQLQKLWSDAGSFDRVGYAVPSYWSRDQLALLLGISEELGIPVAGIAELAVAATRRSYPVATLLHIDLCAHSCVVSRLDQADGPLVAVSDTLENVGAVSLERSCADFFARRFLECSRFDPMHAAASEQRVFDQLDEWLAQLSRVGEARLSFAFEGNEFTADVTAAQLATSLQLRCQPLLQMLRSRLGADAGSVLQVDARLAKYPGVIEALQEIPGCSVFVLEAGAAARGIEARQSSLAQQEGGFSLSATLAWDQPPADMGSALPEGSAGNNLPTHLLAGNAIYPLGAKVLRIGAEALPDEYGLVLDAHHGAVSRQHCSIEREGNRIVLSDYSRYGTLLNGHRVDGSAVLQAGDVISIGEPACELRLLAEVVADGT